MKIQRFDITRFDEIDSIEKAYWLGFILGDGSLSKAGLSIELNEKDIIHLEKVNTFLGGDYIPIKSDKNCFRIGFYSTLFSEKLEKYIPKNKTYNLINHPSIEPIYLSHYYRGLLDSDGWITEHKLKSKTSQYEFGFCNYNIEFLQPIQDWASNHIGKTVGSIRFRKFNSSNGSVSQLIIGGSKNYVKLYDILYEDSNESIRLDRKYDKATNFYNIVKSRPDRRFREFKS